MKYRVLTRRFGFKKGANLPLYVGFCSTLNDHLYLEGVGGTNIGPNPLYLWLLFLENWTGTLPKPNRRVRTL